MVKVGKKWVVVEVKVDCSKSYMFDEVVVFVKEVNMIKFDVFVDLYVCLGVDLWKVD